MLENPFHSFWMAGYESADHLNCFGNRVDFVNITGHLENINEDYQLLSTFNIKTVREGIRWSQVEKQPYHYDWSDVETMMLAAKENGIQQIWDICHFGFPDDLTPLHPLFAKRFTALCVAFIEFYRSVDTDSFIIITPINEVSFLSWLGGEVRGTSPYCIHNGWEVKYALMRAYIEAVIAIKAIDDKVIIMITEPLVNMVPPLNADAQTIVDAIKEHEDQFQVLDILCGRICPELGGHPGLVDIIGCNYYYNNQWIIRSCEFLPWANENNDPRWKPLSALIENLYNRYNYPIVLTETSHPGEDRPAWINFISNECNIVIEKNIPLWGICWYPIIDRPDWDHLYPWHKAGIWEIENSPEQLKRILHEPSAEALMNAMSLSVPALNFPNP
ncbi:MAG: amine oxidase [Chitinophagaceae bacterium]|nr:amine oxidase [Chitinophagaceae bacterium]